MTNLEPPIRLQKRFKELRSHAQHESVAFDLFISKLNRYVRIVVLMKQVFCVDLRLHDHDMEEQKSEIGK